MRHMKFKGKINTIHGDKNQRKDDWFGKWIVGFPQITTDRQAPWNVRMNPIGHRSLFSFTVDPETICECTFAHDKDGNDIYEHDILDIDGEKYEVLMSEFVGWELSPMEPHLTESIHLCKSVADTSMVVGNRYDDYEPPVYGKGGLDTEQGRLAVNEVYKDTHYYLFRDIESKADVEEMER